MAGIADYFGGKVSERTWSQVVHLEQYPVGYTVDGKFYPTAWVRNLYTGTFRERRFYFEGVPVSIANSLPESASVTDINGTSYTVSFKSEVRDSSGGSAVLETYNNSVSVGKMSPRMRTEEVHDACRVYTPGVVLPPRAIGVPSTLKDTDSNTIFTCPAEVGMRSLTYALAHARKPHAFDELTTPERIDAAVSAWVSALNVTREEVIRACRYAAIGFDDAVPATNDPGGDVRHRADKTIAAANLAALESRLVKACATLKLSPDQLAHETPMRLDMICESAAVELGKELVKDEARLRAEYDLTLREIVRRLKGKPG